MTTQRTARFTGMAWRSGSRRINDQGIGFWFRIRGYGLAWSVVGLAYRALFSERYSGQHNIHKRWILYVPVWPGKRWRFEWLTPR